MPRRKARSKKCDPERSFAAEDATFIRRKKSRRISRQRREEIDFLLSRKKREKEIQPLSSGPELKSGIKL